MNKRNIILAIVVIVILALLAVILIPRLSQPQQPAVPNYYPTNAWHTSTPEAHGLDSARIAAGLQAMHEKPSAIDGLLVVIDGDQLLDASFYPYNSANLHDLASVTKSFMTTLIGIAAGQGKLNLDDKVLSFFPDRQIANRDAWKEALTVRDLTRMRNGMASGCLAGDRPTIAEMSAQPDWVQAALDRKMVKEPGTEWCYDSPGMHLLSAILTKATGQTAHEFAEENLFEPLGITESYWVADPQGITRGWGDLHLKPADAAKLGYLWLAGGVWDGKQVVPADWVKESVRMHSDLGGGDGYGSGWWLFEDGYGARGRGGQNVLVVPALKALVVTLAGGIDYDTEVDPWLSGSVVDPENPLPANPAGEQALADALVAVSQPDAPQPVAPLPDTARQISGKTFVFDRNPADLETFRLEFPESGEPYLYFKNFGNDMVAVPLGLDGIYRQSPRGDLMRGYWKDDSTFVLELKDVDVDQFQFIFDGDKVTFYAPAHKVRFEGQAGGS